MTDIFNDLIYNRMLFQRSQRLGHRTYILNWVTTTPPCFSVKR